MTAYKKAKKLKKEDRLFYILMMAYPVVQFCIFYIVVNFQSILLAFQKIDILEGTTTYTFDTMKDAFDLFISKEMLNTMKTSFEAYFISLIFGLPLALFFSYYVYKKQVFSGVFRIILFMPSIVSAIVMSTIFEFFVERGVPNILMEMGAESTLGLLENPDTRFTTIMFYCIWFGFGTNVLLYTNGMSGISKDLLEAANLDGCSTLAEFWHIILPGIYPTLSTFLLTGVAGIFLNQINLFNFYGNSAPEEIQTWGYYLYVKVQTATSTAEYTTLAALGLIITCIAIPITLLAKQLIEKLGPSEE